MTIEEYAAKGAELRSALSMQRLLGVKFCKSVDEIPAKARRPMRDYKYHMTICQAFVQARTTGVTIGLDFDDNYCAIGMSVYGLASFEYTFFPQHVKDQEAACKLDERYNNRAALLPKDVYKAVVVSPFDRLLVEPDVIIAYGVPGQVGRLARAFNYHGEVASAYYFGLGCSNVVQSFADQKPYMVVPGGGEKLFAGVSDFEMSIVFPANRLDDVLVGFKGTQRLLPYPTVVATLNNEASFPEDFHISYKDVKK